jgi:Cu(I)/Ag(I) efflux system periplasmic protein CusF
MIARIAMIAVLGAALAAPVLAQKAPDDHSAHHGAAPAQAPLADGEIRKVDKQAKKITIKHGPIPSIDMPAMTMVFQVKDPKMLDQVKAGDKVKFEAELLPGGRTIVTRIEVMK